MSFTISRFQAASSVPSQAIQPRFGWSAHDHKKIEQAAVTNEMYTPQLKQFLVSNMANLHKHSQDMDKVYRGEHHYLNFTQGKVLSPPLSKEQRNTLVKLAHTPNNEQRLLQAVQQGRYTFDTLQNLNKKNIINTSYAKFLDLVEGFKRLKHSPHTPEAVQNLIKTTGHLSHLAGGDMVQPLHTTPFYTYPLPKKTPFSQDAHKHFEHLAKHHDDNNSQFDIRLFRSKLVQPSKQVPLSDGQVKQVMAGEFLRAHTKMFPLVQTDFALRDKYLSTSKPSPQEMQSYYEALKASWLPIALEQQVRGTRRLAQYIETAYAMADQPSLPSLSPVSESKTHAMVDVSS
jgi:hypothetical protein